MSKRDLSGTILYYLIWADAILLFLSQLLGLVVKVWDLIERRTE